MHGSREVVRCFSNAEIEQLLYKHLDVAIRNFNYAPVENMAVDQDAIAFRLYVTPSETQPSIRTEYGNEATKVQNLYVYCQFLTRFDPMRGHPLNKFPPARAFSKAPALFFGGKSAAGKTKIFDGGIDNRLCMLYS